MLIAREFPQLDAHLTEALAKMNLQRETISDLFLIQ